LDRVQPKCHEVVHSGDPDGVRGRGFKHLRSLGLYPIDEAVAPKLPHKIAQSEWPQLVEASKSKTLRELADDFGVSHEAVRRTLLRANGERNHKRAVGWALKGYPCR